MRRALMALLLCCCAAQALADDYLVVSGLAKHLDGRQHCNSTTSGLGLESGGVAAGFYRNSNCRWSAYAGRAWLPLQLADWRGGILAGGATGYANRAVTPAAALVAAYEPGSGPGLNLVFIPPIGKSGNVLWVQLKWRIK